MKKRRMNSFPNIKMETDMRNRRILKASLLTGLIQNSFQQSGYNHSLLCTPISTCTQFSLFCCLGAHLSLYPFSAENFSEGITCQCSKLICNESTFYASRMVLATTILGIEMKINHSNHFLFGLGKEPQLGKTMWFAI